MKLFEYDCKTIILSVSAISENRSMLNEMGKQGWELLNVCASSGMTASVATCFFKREISDYQKRNS
ncbi:MAG: DUF4177 domain-containing protein [Firmicutes bacterium]|nr:DUF4177 domain-containing protein [Bacillota bacterium]